MHTAGITIPATGAQLGISTAAHFMMKLLQHVFKVTEVQRGKCRTKIVQ
jgi:hypothetical protein